MKSQFFKSPTETKTGLKDQIVQEVGGEMTFGLRKGSDCWFELSKVSKNRGFEKLGLYCIVMKPERAGNVLCRKKKI